MNNRLSAKELTERYIFDVMCRLPAAQRKDIGMELRSLIEDMLGDRDGNGKTEIENTSDVLTELGSPARMAEKYRDGKSYLIGPEYYMQYCFLLRIVLLAVGFGMMIATIVLAVTGEYQTVWEAVGSALSNIVTGLIAAFGLITVLFALFERFAVKPHILQDTGSWNPRDLPEIPDKKALIPKSDPIVSMIFIVAVIILFNFAPYLMGVFTVEDGVLHTVPLFALPVLKTMLPMLNICFLLGIIREVIRVMTGRYTLKLGVATAVLNIVALFLACQVFFDPQIWNTDLVSQVMSLENFVIPNAAQLQILWSGFTKYFGYIFIFAFALDSAISLYKGIRYGKKSGLASGVAGE